MASFKPCYRRFMEDLSITCPNGVTHTKTGEDDWIEFWVEPDDVDYFTEQGFELEPCCEEWEVQEVFKGTLGIDEDYARSLMRFNVPNLRSIVDPEKSMDVYEIAKCFKVDFFRTKCWIRFIDSCQFDHYILDSTDD